MALMNCRINSQTLMRRTSLNIYVPELPHSDGRKGFPVIYLLHGRSGDENSFVDHGINFLCEKYEFIVVMPDGGRSFYMDTAAGEKWWTFLSDELPKLIGTMFPVRRERENTFAAGLSMGGYGALKLGLRYPERFGKIGAMSAVADIGWAGRPEGGMSAREVHSLFGSPRGMLGGDDDLFELLKRPAPACGRPELKLLCGDADILIAENREFVDRANVAGWPLIYEETPNMGHCWDFWMPQLPKIFEFFQKKASSSFCQKTCSNSAIKKSYMAT